MAKFALYSQSIVLIVYSYCAFQKTNNKGADQIVPMLSACNKIRFSRIEAQYYNSLTYSFSSRDISMA